MLNQKIYYSMKYAMIGDIIGFGNGKVEFNFFDKKADLQQVQNFTLNHVFNFIKDGGFSNFDFSNLIVSDDSILALAVFDAIKKTYKTDAESIIEAIKKNIIKYVINDDKQDKRYYGETTINSLQLIKKGKDWKEFKYSKHAGGCGASIRSMSIGFYLNGAKNLNKLIEVSIQSSRITHNNGIGYIGGFMSAYFTSLAIDNVNPIEWINFLLNILKDNIIKTFIIETVCKVYPDQCDYHMNDLKTITYLLDKYKNDRFAKGKLIQSEVYNHLYFRPQLFNQDYNIKDDDVNIGSNGFDSVLYAYDALLESNGNFEKLIYYSMLHYGDSDSTGCIAGAFFGAYYGNINLPKNYDNFNYLDKLDELFNES